LQSIWFTQAWSFSHLGLPCTNFDRHERETHGNWIHSLLQWWSNCTI
jgi:hypothetical protein